MRTCCFKNCRIKHVKYAFYTTTAIISFAVLITTVILGLLYPSSNWTSILAIINGINGPLQIVLRHRELKRFLAQLFPFSCGHRKWIFTGSSSKSLQTILLSIHSYLPTLEEMNQCKDDAQAFFSDINTELENKFENARFECIFAGSIEERFGIPYSHKKRFPSQFNALYSDFDMMFCCDAYRASFCYMGNVQIEHLLIEENRIVHGFARLKSLAHSSGEETLDSKEFLKNVRKAVRSSKVEHLPGDPCCCSIPTDVHTNIQGPSVKVSVLPQATKKRFEGDITVCIKCLEWPILSDWPTRQGRSWPTMDNVRRITSLGFHLVAKPLTYNRERLPAWRFSFSLAEVELSKLVPDTARKCYLALKVIMKDHLRPVVPALSSYHIKTIFYNTLEKKPITFWVVENIEECFLTLLKELHDTLKSGYCRHFWLKGVDLFCPTEIFKTKTLSLLAKKVERIQKDPAPYIYDDGCCCLCCPCCTRCRCASKTPNGLASHIVVVDGEADVRGQAVHGSYGTFSNPDEVV